MAKKKNAGPKKVLRWRDKIDAEAARLKSLEPPPPPPPERPPLRPADDENILLEIRRIAYFDPGELFDEEDKPIPIAQLPADVRAAISGLEAIEQFDWENASEVARRKVISGMLKKYRITDKLHALEMLAKYRNLFAGDPAEQRDYLQQAVNALKDPDNRR